MTVTIKLLLALLALTTGGTLALLVVRLLARSRNSAGQAAGEPDWKTLYVEESRKREELFGMIQSIQGERDRWKDIFWQASAEHGVAQEYMVRVNQHFAKLCGKHPDAKMARMAEIFREKYGEEEKLKIAGRIRAAPMGTLAASAEGAPSAVAKPGSSA